MLRLQASSVCGEKGRQCLPHRRSALRTFPNLHALTERLRTAGGGSASGAGARTGQGRTNLRDQSIAARLRGEEDPGAGRPERSAIAGPSADRPTADPKRCTRRKGATKARPYVRGHTESCRHENVVHKKTWREPAFMRQATHSFAKVSLSQRRRQSFHGNPFRMNALDARP